MSEPQLQDAVPDPPAPLPTKSDGVASQSLGISPPPPPPPPPPPYTRKPALPTSRPVVSRARLWSILAAISTIFLVYGILYPGGCRIHRSELEPVAATDLEVWSCHPHRPLNFGADKQLSERLGLKLVEDVPADKIPGDGRKFKGGEDHGRVIVIGDVHGMFHELVSLLAKVKFNAESDYLILAGDMISKGPDSLKVLDLVRHHGAGCVRGNHEDRILIHYHQLQEKKKKKEEKKEKKEKKKHDKSRNSRHKTGISPRDYNPDLKDDMEMDDMEMEDDDPSQQFISKDNDPDSELNPSPFETDQLRTDQKLARKLTRKQAAWLNACPLVLRMNKTSDLGQVNVVHAGLVHGVRLEDQDAKAIMNMRTLDRHCHLPTSRSDGQHWAKLWNREEKKTEGKGEHTTVIYGHYAAAGLDIRRYTKGLDSNCVRGGRLTAYVISSKHQEVVSVKCRHYLRD